MVVATGPTLPTNHHHERSPMPTITTPSGRKVKFTSNFRYVWILDDAPWGGAQGRSNNLTTARVRAQEAGRDWQQRYGDVLVYDQGSRYEATTTAKPALIGRYSAASGWITLDGKAADHSSAKRLADTTGGIFR